MSDDEINVNLDQEFPPTHGRKSSKQKAKEEEQMIFHLVKSVLSNSMRGSVEYRNAQWEVGDWVEFLGPDQEWHLSKITRVDVVPKEVENAEAIRAAIEKSDLLQAEFVRANAENVRANNVQIDTNREVLELMQKDIRKLSERLDISPENQEKVEGILKSAARRDRSIDAEQAKSASSNAAVELDEIV
ncbi:hypothetical protein TeGR_g4538, partial [Tetraparma gracilis]